MRNPAFSAALFALSCVPILCAPLAASAQAPADPIMKGRDGTTTKKGQYGKFIPDYGPPCKDPNHEKLRQALKKAKYLEGFTTKMNNFVVITRDVPVSIRELGTPNAFWNNEKGTVTLSYEIIDDFAGAFAQEGAKGEELLRHVINASNFVMYHEIGHALISELGLPTTGREEDSVDQFATYILLLTTSSEKKNRKDTSSGGYAAIDAAKYFALTSSTTSISQSAFWDSHSLNQQRFYDILAMVYGSNPDGYAYLVKTGMLPAERAQGADLAWLKTFTTWGRLTNPYSPAAVARYDKEHRK